MTGFVQARALALTVPLALILGALGSQYLGGLFPCEYCHFQRWPHYTAIALAFLAFLARPPQARMLTALAALAILGSGLIGGWHAGIEYGWWDGLTRCSTPGATSITDILQAPPVRCDEVQWSLFGISLAGFNFLISTFSGLMIIALLRRSDAKA